MSLREYDGGLRFAANMGFTWDDCAKCGERTLHRQHRCVHCKTAQPVRPLDPVDYMGRIRRSAQGGRVRRSE